MAPRRRYQALGAGGDGASSSSSGDSDADGGGGSAARAQQRRRRRPPTEEERALEARVRKQEARKAARRRVRNFLEGLLWIALATFIVWYGNGRESLVAVVQDAEQVYARYLVAWAVGVCINTAIFLYIAVFVPLVRGDKREWEQTAPWAIPTASLVGVLCFVCFTIGIWPAYRWLSLPVTIALFFGAVFFIGLFPGGKKKEAPAMLQEEEQEAAELLADAQR